MKLLIAVLAILAPCLPSAGQIVESVTGKFHICADDSAVVLVNGVEIFAASYSQKDKVKESAETALKLGDRLVFQLHNKGGPKGLLVQFVSTDRKTLVHFPRNAYRKLTDPQATTFTDSEFRNAPEVKERKHPNSVGILPFKGKSQWVWGENEVCAIGLVVTRELIARITP